MDWEAATGQRADETVFERFTLDLRTHYRSNEQNMRGAILRLIGFTAQYRDSFGDYDMLLSPVLSSPPPQIGYLDTALDFDTVRTRLLQYASFTAPANIAGTPALSLPMGMSRNGLPVGAQFHGKAQREDQLLSLAFELEQAAPWSDRKPPVFAD